MNKKGQAWLSNLSQGLPVTVGFILSAYFYMMNQPTIATKFFWGGIVLQIIYLLLKYGHKYTK